MDCAARVLVFSLKARRPDLLSGYHAIGGGCQRTGRLKIQRGEASGARQESTRGDAVRVAPSLVWNRECRTGARRPHGAQVAEKVRGTIPCSGTPQPPAGGNHLTSARTAWPEPRGRKRQGRLAQGRGSAAIPALPSIHAKDAGPGDDLKRSVKQEEAGWTRPYSPGPCSCRHNSQPILHRRTRWPDEIANSGFCLQRKCRLSRQSVWHRRAHELQGQQWESFLAGS